MPVEVGNPWALGFELLDDLSYFPPGRRENQR